MEPGDGPSGRGPTGAGRPFPECIPWEQHWSFARVELGLSDAAFWALTLHELDVLAVRWRAQQMRRDVPMALLIQLTANINRDSQQRAQPFELTDVLEWLGHTLPPPPPPPQRTAEELAAQIELLHGFYSQAQGHNGTMDG